ncbi:MAG: hypothetical protein AMXMBFR45_24930 [Gammaproteobacteria bacterium]|nr:MAG: DUF3088 domain-containing protein [Pseudomonadota bacterium]MBC6945954.1 DUF3088 domain-containing protein [Gammaproteobacteria bacterium]MCE7896340.1 DUF3088 domain-containing protein [Gammaproteobacteria bacterium PRO8]MDL1881351.1 DUF3088 domain-containing protein [Gammaproteobacteria bacterium PRO2]MCL4777945.1 DUF3088 family protein [Gammaproteobacteria bacterium]
MTKDTLFLLKPDFHNGDKGPFYCPDCALVEGVLSYYPKLRHKLDVRYVDFARPRAEIVALLGEANQGCPVLVLADGRRVLDAGIEVQEAQGRRFIAREADIRRYLSGSFGIGHAA